jgi:hypothetical protein
MRRSALPRSQWLAAAVDLGQKGFVPNSGRTGLLDSVVVERKKNLQKGFLFFGLTNW